MFVVSAELWESAWKDSMQNAVTAAENRPVFWASSACLYTSVKAEYAQKSRSYQVLHSMLCTFHHRTCRSPSSVFPMDHPSEAYRADDDRRRKGFCPRSWAKVEQLVERQYGIIEYCQPTFSGISPPTAGSVEEPWPVWFTLGSCCSLASSFKQRLDQY